MYAIYVHRVEPHPSEYKKNAPFVKGDTGYYSGGTDNYILTPETFSLSSFLFLSNEIRETKRNEKLKKKG